MLGTRAWDFYYFISFLTIERNPLITTRVKPKLDSGIVKLSRFVLALRQHMAQKGDS